MSVHLRAMPKQTVPRRTLASSCARAKVGRVMHEYKANSLHSSSSGGRVVRSRKQALAIALHEAERACKRGK